MAGRQTSRKPRIEGNDPFGMSRFSIRRYSVQHFILLALTNLLLAAMAVAAALWGNTTLVVLSALALTTVIVKTVLVVWVGLRTIAVEAWIRRLGMGDFEYRIEPQGNDEVSKACLALETLRQRSIEVVRLQLVEKLSAELEAANDVLEDRNVELQETLSQLREAQDQLVAHEKLREMIELASGVAHEIRNPLNFVANFCDGSSELLDELMESLTRPQRDEEEIAQISAELRVNMDHIRRNVGRADRVLQGMINLGSSHGAWQEVSLNLLVRQSVQASLDSWASADGGDGPVVEVWEDPTDPQCLAVPEAMALAVMSLVQNSWDAVRERGNTDSPITVSIRSEGEEARVIFRDEGCGMTAEVLEKSMAPFFTTKRGDSQGAGLGLCQAAEVARSHGGSIALESRAGEGATATLTVKMRPTAATAPGLES